MGYPTVPWESMTMTDWSMILSISLIQNMFYATLMASILCGIIGTYVVIKRIVFVSGGIAHATFGGVGFAYYVQSVLLVSWFDPMIGAMVFAVGAALIIGSPRVNQRLRDDSTIGVLWVVGMALGVLFINLTDHSVVQVRSYESILFGNVLLVSTQDLQIMAIMIVVILAVVAFLYRDLQIVTFDEAHARITGINVTLMNTLLYVLVAITCVFVMNIVGIVLVIALLTMPAALASMFSNDMRKIMGLAIVSATILSLLGLVLAIEFDIPPGASIVLTLGVFFMISMGIKTLHEKGYIS